MTILNTETGELVDLDRAAAERRAERITLRLESIADNTEAVKGMIREAIAKRDDVALGYRSLGEYVSDRFGGSLGRLGIEVRRAFVAELTDAGMSTRAIAPVVGVSQKTVVKDRQVIPGVSPVAPIATPDVEGGGTTERQSVEAPAVVQPEGESFPPAAATPAAGEGEPEASPARPPVVGIDGKTYSPPKPAPKSILDGSAADYDNAEKSSLALARAISKLLQFQHPNMRSAMRKYWKTASIEVPPTPRRDVTPEQMRVAAQGLLTLADEWDES